MLPPVWTVQTAQEKKRCHEFMVEPRPHSVSFLGNLSAKQARLVFPKNMKLWQPPNYRHPSDTAPVPRWQVC